MVQAISGERENESLRRAFTALAREFYEPVYYFIAKQTPGPEDAADITQQVFIKAFKSFERYDPERDFAPWIFTIARRCVADFYRRRKTAVEQLEDTFRDPEPDPHEQTARREGADRLWDLASGLKPKFFQVLLLHYKENFNLEETAQVMGITVTHAKVLLFRARNALKKRLSATDLTGGLLP